MLGFGIFIYGPLQFYWYNLLDWLMPIRTTATFLSKVNVKLSSAQLLMPLLLYGPPFFTLCFNCG
jgi:hypothetical protein